MLIIPLGMETTYADSWSDMAQPCDMDLWVMKWKSRSSDFALKTIWYMYIILSEYESERPDVWPQNIGHCDLYFMVQWLCLTPWIFHVRLVISCINIIICDYGSVWPDAWPQNKWSLWPIFHGPVILCYILKTIWCMNIILEDYGSVWLDIWPLNKCMSLWPIFHGSLILPYISKTIWWMSVIFSDNETVLHKLWPQTKYRSIWPIFYGLVILLNIFKIIWWMNIIVGIVDQCNTKIDLIKYI